MKKIIKEELFKLADEKYKQFHSGLCPGTTNIIGVRVPVLRHYAKQLAREYNIQELLSKIDIQYYEEVMLQGMLIGLMKDDFINIEQQIKKFVPKINNWAICDVFCASLKVTKNYKKEMWELIQEYLKSTKEFDIRFAVVMILDYYIDKQYLEDDFKIFKSIKNEGYYVKMAVAWAISLCLVKFYEETISYLKEVELDEFTYNKALQKAIESYRITDEQKKELRKMKIV